MSAGRAYRVEPAPVGDLLPGADYTDACAVGLEPDARTAPEWARAVFEGAPPPARLFLRAGWRLLGIRLGPASADHVLGWRIAATTPAQVVLAADSRVVGPTRLLLRVEPHRTVLATYLRREGPVARPVWALIAPLHRPILRALLARAAASR